MTDNYTGKNSARSKAPPDADLSPPTVASIPTADAAAAAPPPLGTQILEADEDVGLQP